MGFSIYRTSAAGLIFIVCCVLGGSAQENVRRSPDITIDGVGLDGVQSYQLSWRYSTVDDLRFADPNFDDAAWPTMPSGGRLTVKRSGSMVTPTNIWIRIHLRLTQPALAAAVSLTAKGYLPYQVYGNGRLLAESPGFARGELMHTEPFAVMLPSGGDVLLALRFLIPRTYTPIALPLQALSIGSPMAIEEHVQFTRLRNFDETKTAQILGTGLSLALGLCALVLYLAQRSRREYRWLSLFGLFYGSFIALKTAIEFGFLSGSLLNLMPYRYAGLLAIVCFVEFVLAIAGMRAHRAARWLECTLLALPVLGFWSQSIFDLGLVLMFSITTAYVIRLFVRAYLRGVAEIKLLLPSAAAFALINTWNYVSLVFPDSVWFPRRFHVGSVGIGADDLSVWFLLTSVIGVMLFRFVRVSHEERYAAAELEAARNVQNVLIPDESPVIEGFSIDSVYQPARQVGGDFFQIIPLPDSAGTLIAIGDVSGKGLPAAMTVAVIVGALRATVEHTHHPGEIMSALNRRLHGRGVGFTTCILLRLEASGKMVMTSAGHLEPYLAGKAVALEIALPLGLSLESTYLESSFTLETGSALTLLTDGVVEALHPRSRELFGFDRTLAVSMLPAHAIAEAANRFAAPAHQADDITILTIAHTCA